MNNNVVVILGGTTISDHVSSVTLNREVDAVEITAMSDTDHVFLKGLNANSVSLEFFNDFAATSVNSLIDDAMGTYLNLKLIPVSGTVTSTNPSYTMSCFIQQWQPISGTPQDVATASVTWPVKALTKSTSA
ncbi:MAG: hypothetical protein EB054_03525 [Actinobacteria bacterium]|nr:hypothetical protein [Actinomycetota bacterium]